MTSEVRTRRGGIFMYYRTPDGWIHPASAHENDQLIYARGGWVPLPEYGTFNWKPYDVNHPYDTLFRAGGAKEMPADQVIQLSYVRTPPVVDGATVKFPQMVGISVPLIDCPFCDRPMPTEAALKNHSEVMHSDKTGSREMAKAIIEGLAPQGEKTKEQLS